MAFVNYAGTKKASSENEMAEIASNGIVRLMIIKRRT